MPREWRQLGSFLFLFGLLQQALTLTFLTILIGMLFRLLAPCVLPRRTLITGALVTAVLFEIGKWAIGLYLGSGSVGSTFGAAGSLAAEADALCDARCVNGRVRVAPTVDAGPAVATAPAAGSAAQ